MALVAILINSAIADKEFAEGTIISLYHKRSSFRNKNRYDSELPYQRPKVIEVMEIEIGLIYTSQNKLRVKRHCNIIS